MEEAKEAAIDFSPYIVMFNTVVVSAILIGLGRFLAARKLTADVPEGRQNVGEFILDFFINKARDMAHGAHRDRVVRAVTPVLAGLFLIIFVCNLVVLLPIPKFNRPPTSFFSVTLGLAITAIGSTLVASGVFKGIGGAIKHLFWPNPMQWVSEITDVLSLSLRLFGNIGGEYMTLTLVVSSVYVGIPLLLHILGLIPAFVQALVFTLLTASFMASAVESHAEAEAEVEETSPAPAPNAAVGATG